MKESLYKAVTFGVGVSVAATYLDYQSDPDNSQFAWAYHVRIENRNKKSVQLLSRNWSITDALGNGHWVIGEGVVGEKPILQPGEAFEYTSGTPLQTPSGIMAGFYRLIDEDGYLFYAEVPAFSLDSPYEEPSLH
ncbi:MAG: Protein ApaG [Alphaproteobacteria bacterium MarineAlpha3_Bin5]|nr:Co2+/Mg2+ efflux protein ApaG [Magnetovibrio sp.]PPR79049.1 MAG: Protein ApaG [Alphaproteobacteria bacterium MarineAlpha3_Bin5]